MSSEVKKYLPILRLLAKATPYKRKKILLAADTKLIQVIIECCYNTLNGNVKLSKQKINKLKRHSKVLRNLSKVTKNTHTKKQILVQQGGAFLPLILPSIISSLFTLL
jgi:hypothetical protein